MINDNVLQPPKFVIILAALFTPKRRQQQQYRDTATKFAGKMAMAIVNRFLTLCDPFDFMWQVKQISNKYIDLTTIPYR